ncbi:hypothetical protein Pfo_005535 [Paulownia fortunei]|nr:hypothetical protein Pfo_005535 [Paulownia fortunei]
MRGGKILMEASSDVHEMSKFVNIKRETLHPSSSQKMQCCNNDIVLEEEHYLVSMKDNLIKLELDHQTILIGDCPSLGALESFPVNGMINLVEQDLHELPEKPDHTNSLFLFLQRNNHLNLIHSSFFDSMLDLRFLDLSNTRIRILPSSLFRLSKLKALMLRNCVYLEKLPSETGKLNHMEVLDLSGTELYNLPVEIGQLTRLRHMQLSFYGPDDEREYVRLPCELFSQSILSDLKAIEALSIIVHPEDHRWTKLAACIMKDVGSLERLNFIQFYFPEVENFQDFIQMSTSWKNHRLKKFKFIVGHNVKRIISRVPNKVESLYDQQDQCFRFVNADKVPQVIKTVLVHVTAFYLDHHLQVQSLSDFGISNFKALKFCVVRECPKVQAIINEESSENAFSCLEHLRVYYLWELKQIWKLPSGDFHALKYLMVNTCPKLQFILWESMLQCLSNLEEVVVEDCESVEKIVEEEKDIVNNDAIMLPRLRKLVLRYLPKLVSLGNGLWSLSEEKISTYCCPNLILSSQPRKQKRVKLRKFLGSLRGCSICI